MEDSTQLQTLKLSIAAPRRLLHCSRRYLQLGQLFAQFPADFPQTYTQGDMANVESRQTSEENFRTSRDELNSTELLGSNESEVTLVQETTIDKSNENDSFQAGGFDGDQKTVQETDSINFVTESVECPVLIINEQKSTNSGLEIQTEDFGPLGLLEVDEEFSVDDFSEAFDSCFGTDMMVESSKLGDFGKDNRPALEVNMSNEVEHQVQLKEIELEKLVSRSLTADQDIEEGEISGEAEDSDRSIDAISIDDAKDSVDQENFTSNNDNDCPKVEHGATSRKVQDIQSQNIFRDSGIETRGINCINASLENLPPPGRIPVVYTSEILDPIATEKDGLDGDINKNKRKRGPPTEGKKAKKKQKKRRKRAEMNEKLGVKRLKLAPNVKPKTTTYCRHYLRGRCHEGENCKFSHDTTPSTKSEPCIHFARNSCMKGDECPYDHQLNKYPCHKHASGECTRGANCYFSHEITPVASNVSKTESKSEQHVKSPPQLNNSNSNNRTDFHPSSHHKIDPKIGSVRDSPGKTTGNYAPKPFVRTVLQAPKGVSFLSNEKTPPGNISKIEPNNSYQKAGDGAIPKVKETSEGVTPRRPKGINFLSFAKSSSDDSSSKITFPNLFSTNSCNETGKSVVADSSPKSGDFLKFNSQIRQSALQKLNEEANITPVKMPSLSFGVNMSGSIKTPLLPNTPSFVQRAVQSTLAFAAKFEPEIKLGNSLSNGKATIS